MAGKKRKTTRSKHRPSSRDLSLLGFYTPFKDLDQHLARNSPPAGASPQPEKPSAVVQQKVGEDTIFFNAMADVAPLPRSQRERVPPSPPTKAPPRFLAQEEIEVYAHLVDLVTGDGPFELTYSDEYVDGAVVGLSPEILKKLRNGDFSYQDCLDLHGYNSSQARDLVTQFVRESFAHKLRCILIVCGRGLNSAGREPVLKQNLVTWLTRAPLKRIVLAFACARSRDGGAGAFYVLVRRNKGKAPFVCPAR